MDVGTWLRGLGLERYEQAFRDNDIELDLLPTLSTDDLREMGVGSLGHRKQLLAAIAALVGGTDGRQPIAAAAAAPPSTQAERRQLTVMFVDLVGSTALSSRLDPEDMREVLHAYQNAVTGVIARFGGYVAKLMGDGVLAYFGWPCAHEDEAERAVQAGLAIVDVVGRLAMPVKEALAARVGIATGLAIVGDLIGEGAAREEAIIGETPNLAARLQQATLPGTVMIAGSTRRLIGEMFELREIGPIELKGFDHPLTGFQVAGERTSGSRFESLRSSRSLPMVGRDQELALVLERWRQAVAGEGQAVLLVGEAGIGKSRLIQAVLDAAVGNEHVALRYQCSPHHTGTPLWPVAQQLALAAGIASAAGEGEKLDHIEAMLRQGAIDLGAGVPLIAALLGIEPSIRYPKPTLTATQQRSRTLGVLVEYLLELARRLPVLVVFEDTHWIDPTSLEFLGQALDRTAGARLLMLLTSRPDNQPTLGGHPDVTRLTLNRLGRGPTEAIIARLTGDTTLPRGLLGEIAARTDGVPLFVEELTKAVLETGSAGAVTTVPGSLYASLMARLDRVPEVKQVAQVAACIGREFTYRLLATVSPLPESELRAALDRLGAAELIFRRGTDRDVSYTFKHALVRDAAHESLLKAQRQQLHARIGRALEEHFPEMAASEPELLARHYTEAGQAERAVDYWQRAGQQALVRSATAEAVVHLTEGLKLLNGLASGPERQRRELGLQIALGQASIAAKGFAAAETGRAYARARELCRELGDTPQLFPVLYGQSVFHFQRGEVSAAHGVARELLRLAQERGDAAAQVTGHRMIGSATSQLGRFAESRDHFEAALALYDPARDRSSAIVYAIDSRVMCTSWLSHLLLLLGRPNQALARDAEVPAYVRELGHANTAAVALAWGCIFRQLMRDRQNARVQADAVVELATEQGFPLYRAAGMVVRGWTLVDDGHAEDGIEEIRSGLADYTATGAAMWSPYFLGLLAEAESRSGHTEAALGTVADALDRAGRSGVHWIEAELHRLRGELLIARASGDAHEGDACLQRALGIAGEQGAALWQLRAAASLARLRSKQGRPRVSQDLLMPIYSQYTEGFETRDLRETKALIDNLG
jgi:predicted ATPase/class 3 adenylate cyclase